MTFSIKPLEPRLKRQHFFDVCIIKNASSIAESPLSASDFQQLKRVCTFIKYRTESMLKGCALFTLLMPLFLIWWLEAWDYFGLTMTLSFLGFIGLSKLAPYVNGQHYRASVKIDNKEYIEPLDLKVLTTIEFDSLKSIAHSNLACKYVKRLRVLNRESFMLDKLIVQSLNAM